MQRRLVGRARVERLIRRYRDAWNDAAGCSSTLTAILSPHAIFTDPVAQIVGPSELAAHIERMQRTAGPLHLELTGPVLATAQWASFPWILRSSGRTLAGHDIVELDAHGKLARIVGFWSRSRP